MFRIEYTPEALQGLKAVPSEVDRNAVVHRIKELRGDPYHAKALKYDLEGYHRAKAAGGRCRILFRINEPDATVQIVLIGLRSPGDELDAYEMLRRSVRNREPSAGGEPE